MGGRWLLAVNRGLLFGGCAMPISEVDKEFYLAVTTAGGCLRLIGSGLLFGGCAMAIVQPSGSDKAIGVVCFALGVALHLAGRQSTKKD